MAHSTILKLTTLLILTTLATAQVFCAQAIVTTKSYDCALIASAGSCPVNTALGYSYWAVTATGSTVTATGCCAATATPHSVENGIACCPCEASCMGYMPAMCEWNTDNGALAIIQTSPTPLTLTVPTASVLTPFHGPETAPASSTVTEGSGIQTSTAEGSFEGTPVTTKSFSSPASTYVASSGNGSSASQGLYSTTSVTSSLTSASSGGSSRSGSAGSSQSSSAATQSVNAGNGVKPPGIFQLTKGLKAVWNLL